MRKDTLAMLILLISFALDFAAIIADVGVSFKVIACILIQVATFGAFVAADYGLATTELITARYANTDDFYNELIVLNHFNRPVAVYMMPDDDAPLLSIGALVQYQEKRGAYTRLVWSRFYVSHWEPEKELDALEEIVKNVQ